MTFGQILAVLLLLAPLVPIIWALVAFVRRGRWVYDGTVITRAPFEQSVYSRLAKELRKA